MCWCHWQRWPSYFRESFDCCGYSFSTPSSHWVNFLWAPTTECAFEMCTYATAAICVRTLTSKIDTCNVRMNTVNKHKSQVVNQDPLPHIQSGTSLYMNHILSTVAVQLRYSSPQMQFPFLSRRVVAAFSAPLSRIVLRPHMHFLGM